MQAEDGGSVYLRLSTRPLEQPRRSLSTELAGAILRGGYWLIEPAADADVHLVASGPVVQEAIEAHGQIAEDIPGAGLLVVTSPDLLQRGWLRSQRSGSGRVTSHVEQLLSATTMGSGLVTVLDGHSATLSWLGAVRGQPIVPLGVERFGQSGNLPDLYREYGLDADAIIGAVARLLILDNSRPHSTLNA